MFEIFQNGNSVFEETFTSNAAFLSFFQDNVLNLGAENAGVNGGSLNLEFSFDFSSAATGAGFNTGLIFGTPEPSSLALLALGGLGFAARLALLRRRRRLSERVL